LSDNPERSEMPAGGPADAIRRFNTETQWHNTIRRFGLYFLIAFGIWQFRLAIDALAGRTTSVYFDALLNLFASLEAKIGITVLLGSCGWAFVERRLRQSQVRRLSARNTELEQRLDPERSSSNLAPTGKTHPRDRGV
jgi:hypothetical protein